MDPSADRRETDAGATGQSGTPPDPTPTAPPGPDAPRLARVARIALLVEVVALLLLGGAGLVTRWLVEPSAGSDVIVAGFRTNTAHSVFLVLTAVMVAAVLRWPVATRHVMTVQIVSNGLLFVFGAAFNIGATQKTLFALNTADLFLHAGLALLGFIAYVLLNAKNFAPPMSPPP